MRDLFRHDRVTANLGGELYPEIAAVWGLALALFLEWEGERLSPDEITVGVIVTIVGAFLTRMVAIARGMKNPGYPERDHHQQMETTPRKPIETSGNLRHNGAALGFLARGHGRGVLSGRGHAVAGMVLQLGAASASSPRLEICCSYACRAGLNGLTEP